MEYNFNINHSVDFTKNYLIEVVEQNYSIDEVEKIKNALQMAIRYHSGQTRSDGNAYVTHPMRVSLLMQQYEKSITVDMFIAALLHDTVEDTELTENEIKDCFGEIVSSYVHGLTRYRAKEQTAETRRQGKIEKWQKIMRSSQEIRIIKTFDHLDNVISMKFIAPEQADFKKIPRWLMQTQSMFLPLAKITNTDAYRLINLELEHYINRGFQIGDWYSDSH